MLYAIHPWLPEFFIRLTLLILSYTLCIVFYFIWPPMSISSIFQPNLPHSEYKFFWQPQPRLECWWQCSVTCTVLQFLEYSAVYCRAVQTLQWTTVPWRMLVAQFSDVHCSAVLRAQCSVNCIAMKYNFQGTMHCSAVQCITVNRVIAVKCSEAHCSTLQTVHFSTVCFQTGFQTAQGGGRAADTHRVVLDNYFQFPIFMQWKQSHKNLHIHKLDGVGPINNRPSTDKLHHFIQKRKKIK